MSEIAIYRQLPMWHTCSVRHSHRFEAWLCLLLALAGSGVLLSAERLQSVQRYRWPTLAEVLRQNSAPSPPDANTSVTINSFGVVNDASQFVIAYYEDTGTDVLRPLLHVLRYDRTARRWHHRDFREGEVKAPFSPFFQPSQSSDIDCLGSASLRTVAGRLLVSTHISPSAECTMILRSDLTLVSAFSGWDVAAIGSLILVERSEIHFAATHPLRLAAIDLATGRERDVFPPADDRFRQQFRQRLRAVADGAWCREHNASCDPEQMSIELGDVAVNVEAKAVAFEVTFDSEGFGPRAESEIGSERCFYVFELAPALRYRQFNERDMPLIFEPPTPEGLVQTESLQQIFANK